MTKGWWFFLALLSCLLAGCGEAIFNAGTDGEFLRDGITVSKSEIPEEELLPTRPGTHWEMTIINPNRSVMEESERLRAVSLPRGGTGYAVDMLQGNKVYRTEVYQVDPQRGIFLVAAGGDQKIELDPPLPVVRFPIEWEKIGQWQGRLTFRGATTLARAWYRVTTKEPLTVAAGKYSVAYRVDTLLDTVIEKKRVLFPTTRWFVPGVGVARIRFSAGRNVYTKELKRYRLGAAGPRPEKTKV